MSDIATCSLHTWQSTKPNAICPHCFKTQADLNAVRAELLAEREHNAELRKVHESDTETLVTILRERDELKQVSSDHYEAWTQAVESAKQDIARLIAERNRIQELSTVRFDKAVEWQKERDAARSENAKLWKVAKAASEIGPGAWDLALQSALADLPPRTEPE